MNAHERLAEALGAESVRTETLRRVPAERQCFWWRCTREQRPYSPFCCARCGANWATRELRRTGRWQPWKE